MGHKDYCCVPGCGNRREDKSGLSFYSIPLKSHERYQAWLDAIGRGSDWLPTPHTRICSAHFVGGKKSNIPHSASYIPTLSLNLVQEGDNVTPKRRKRRSDNDFKAEMGRLNAKSDEYFRMPSTDALTSPLEGLLDTPQQVSQVKAKVRKGLPFGMSPNSLLHHTDASIAESLVSKTDNTRVFQTSSVVETSNASLAPVTINMEQGMGASSASAVGNSSTYATGLSGGGSTHTNNTSSSSKTGTVYSVGSHIQLNVPNPATAFSTSRTPKVSSPEKTVTTSIQVQQPTVFGENVAATFLTPGGYKTVAQLLHDKRVVTNPEQSICKIESVAGGLLPVDSVDKVIAAQQAARRRESISTTWKDVSHMERIFKDLEKFWKQKLYTDVMIKVEEETIEAHKLVVAACSPYLTSLLASLPDAVITIHLPVKKSAMKCILTYMYSGLLKLEDTTVHSVAQAAKLLKMTKVRLLCEKFIEQHNLNKRVPCNYNISVEKAMADSAAPTIASDTDMHVLNRVAVRQVAELTPKSRNLDDVSMGRDGLDGNDSQGECMDDNLVIDEDVDDDDNGCDDGKANDDRNVEAMEDRSSDEVKPDVKSEQTGDDDVAGSQDYENLDSILDQIQADEIKTEGADVGDFISKLLNVHDEINPQPGYPDLDQDASDDDEDEKPLASLKRKNSLERKQQGPFSHLCSICGWRFPSELTCAKHIETRHTGEMNGSKATDFIQHGRYDAVRGENRIYNVVETDEESDLNDSMFLKKGTESQDAASPEMGPLDGIATTISSRGGKPKLAYVCCYCASKYPTIELCRQHTLSCKNKLKMLGLPKNVREERDQTPKKNQGNPLMHGCTECDFTTANKRYMPFHMYYKHDRPLPDELSKISCGICDRKFPSKQALREHISVHEEGGHNCKFCNKSFKYSSSLRGHIQHKHLKEKVFACPKCPHRSKTATQHKVHLSMHERQKLFPCLQCSYQAVTRKNLDIHITQKHPGPSVVETGVVVEEAK